MTKLFFRNNLVLLMACFLFPAFVSPSWAGDSIQVAKLPEALCMFQDRMQDVKACRNRDLSEMRFAGTPSKTKEECEDECFPAFQEKRDACQARASNPELSNDCQDKYWKIYQDCIKKCLKGD